MDEPLAPPIDISLTVLPPQPCSYLPGRMETSRAFRTDEISGDLYHDFMDAGFRRSGTIFYQPICDDCRACVPIRVPVDEFVPSKSQRRTIRRNAGLRLSVHAPVLTDEKAMLYHRYLTQWHQREQTVEQSQESMEQFLYESPTDTLEFCYRTADEQLIAVGIADVCSRSLSSVYFYFEPSEAQRGLGTFSITREIDFCRSEKIPYYYLGFWVDGCDKMQYKNKYRPCELLNPAGMWQRMG